MNITIPISTFRIVYFSIFMQIDKKITYANVYAPDVNKVGNNADSSFRMIPVLRWPYLVSSEPFYCLKFRKI